MKAQQMNQQQPNDYYQQQWHQGPMNQDNQYMYGQNVPQNPHHMHGGVIISQNDSTPLTPPMTPGSQQQLNQQNYSHNMQNHMAANNFEQNNQNQQILAPSGNAQDQPIDLFHNIDEQPGLPHNFEQNPTLEPTFDGFMGL